MNSSLEVYEKIRPTVLREVDGDRLLMEMDDTGKQMVRVHLINEVGARILELIDGSRSLQALSREICKEFDSDPAEVETDVRDFVRVLCSMGQIGLRSAREGG